MISGSPKRNTLSQEKCSLCGLPLGRRPVKGWVNGREMFYCCPGCRAVYQILLARYGVIPEDPTKTELFRECLKAGIISGTESAQDNKISEPQGSVSPDSVELRLHVSGMGCPACAWLLEKVLEKTDGIREVKVSFSSDKAKIRYEPSRLSPKEIMAVIGSMGYQSFSEEIHEAGQESTSRIRLGVAALITAHVMMISWALYVGFLEELSRDSVLYLSIPLLGLSTPVVFWCGLPVLRKGYSGARNLVPNLESLVGLGALSAYFYSLVQFLWRGLHLYFDTACMLVTLVLLGRHLEQRARSSVGGDWLERMGGGHSKARLLERGSTRWVSTREVRKGDLVLVEEGEGVPVDGLVVEGEGTVDLSMLTGESKPVKLGEGEAVLAGAFLLKGCLGIQAKENGERSWLSSMASMVEEALSRPSAWERMADRISRWFVPAVVLLGAGTAIWIWAEDGLLEEALMRGLTVLVVACPCALGVATPLARVAAVGLGRKFGIYIRDPEVLEAGGKIQSLILDKTGTITQGVFSVQEVICFQENPELLLFRASSVELSSAHFLARKVVACARGLSISPQEVKEFLEEPGEGVCGILDGVRICVGNRAWMAKWGLGMSEEQEREASTRESQGCTVIFVGWDGRVRGAMVLGDSLKPGALEVVSSLKDQGFEIWLVSGDSPGTTSWVARQLGVERFLGGVLPQEKASLVDRLSREGKKVCVVGDGINDAPALALAHLGISLGKSLGSPSTVASVQAARTDPWVILDVLEILRRARKTVLQNLVLSLLYNLAAIPAAMAGFLNPPLAVLAMFASSLTVIWNSRLLAKGTLSSHYPAKMDAPG